MSAHFAAGSLEGELVEVPEDHPRRRVLSGIIFVNRNGLLSKAMPVSLMVGDQERWRTASAEEAVSLLGPYPSQLTKMV